jgi:NADH dehydrogenase FAD-containing subunit
MLHMIAAGTSDVSQQETSYIAQARDRRFVFQPGEFKGVDRHAKRVRVGSVTIGGPGHPCGASDSYDTLILSTGSLANDFGTRGVRRYCRTVDSRSQARDLNREIRYRSYYQIAPRALSIGESTCPEKGNQPTNAIHGSSIRSGCAQLRKSPILAKPRVS